MKVCRRNIWYFLQNKLMGLWNRVRIAPVCWSDRSEEGETYPVDTLHATPVQLVYRSLERSSLVDLRHRFQETMAYVVVAQPWCNRPTKRLLYRRILLPIWPWVQELATICSCDVHISMLELTLMPSYRLTTNSVWRWSGAPGANPTSRIYKHQYISALFSCPQNDTHCHVGIWSDSNIWRCDVLETMKTSPDGNESTFDLDLTRWIMLAECIN